MMMLNQMKKEKNKEKKPKPNIKGAPWIILQVNSKV
jgi:hypothetical protein